MSLPCLTNTAKGQFTPTVTSQAQTDSTITLSWTRVNSTEFGVLGSYQVTYATSVNGTYSTVTYITNWDQTNYTVTGLNSSTTYFFIIRYIGNNVAGSNLALSNTLQVSTSPSPTLTSTSTPAISILYPTNGAVFNVSIVGVSYQIIYETNSTLSWVGYSLDGGSNVTVSGNSTYVGSNGIERIENSGYNTLTLYANDTAGNWATPQTVTYLVEYYPDVSTPEFPTWTAVSALAVLAMTVTSTAAARRRKNQPQQLS